ncbi:MAG: CocE/NonD family hydrolase [Planctomycetota bacterium]
MTHRRGDSFDIRCFRWPAASRDGVRLATDIYRPAKDGSPLAERLPAIMVRLPYNKDGQKNVGRYYAARGYVFVAQDTRGRYKSEGVWHMLSDDGPDGCDTAEWVIGQPWSNGRFGMMGTSYFGGTQHAMAMVKAPGLVTVIPVDAMSNLGYQSMRNAGAFELRFWNWILLKAHHTILRTLVPVWLATLPGCDRIPLKLVR